MKFKCCQSALSTLIISDDALSFCCLYAYDEFAFLQNYNGTTDFIEKYKDKRNKFIENCKKGRVNYEACSNCSRFIEQDWDETFGIDYISLTARRKCSCNCTYCIVTNGDTKKRLEYNKKEFWDIKPVLQYLSKNKYLKKEGTLYIAAGECTEYPKDELQWLIKFAKENNFKLGIASSAAFYSKEIEEVLKKGKISLTVSVDSGTKETFEKIKRAKFYDRVWNNLNKYIQASQNNDNAEVVLKYIILEELNDDIKEFDEFLNMCNQINCELIEISMDVNYRKDKNILNVTPTEKIKKLVAHIQNLNDSRIHFNYATPIKEIKTTARKYEKDIEQAIVNGFTTVKIVVFSGTDNTYKKLTNTDLYKLIWTNIQRYAKISEDCTSFFSEIYIQYSIIPGSNDNITEIQSLIDKCESLKIKHIEFELLGNNISNLDKSAIDNLKNTISYIKNLNKLSIRISDKLLNIKK